MEPYGDVDGVDAWAPPSRARVVLSVALLVAGALAFVVSLALPGVTLVLAGDRMRPGGWTCAMNHGPTVGTNWFLALSPLVWGVVRWLRSAWAWWIAVVAGVVACLLHATIGAWPGYEGIEELHAGYWTWLAATFSVAAAFVVLPRPVRPPPGEPLPLEDRDRGRTGLAWILAAAATATILVSHLFVPVPTAERMAIGPIPDGARPYYYVSGPVSTGGWQPTPLEIPRADGTVEKLERHFEYDWTPFVVDMFRGGPSAAVELAYLALPLVFLAAATTRRTAWRWGGAVLAAGAASAAFLWITSPWPCSGTTPHPLDVVWQAPPCALAAAFLLLPPRRAVPSRH